MNKQENAKYGFLIFCLYLKHNKFYRACLTFFIAYLALYLLFLVAEVSLIFANSEILSGYELVLVLVVLYGLFLTIFSIVLKIKHEHQNIEYLKLYFFAFSFLFCILNMGPLLFIEMMLVVSNIIPGQFGPEGTFSCRASIMVHACGVMPIWILVTAWALFQAYKMLAIQFMIKKKGQSVKEEGSDPQIIFKSNCDSIKRLKNVGLSREEKNNNPYLVQNIELPSMISNSVIGSIKCVKTEKKLKDKFGNGSGNKEKDSLSFKIGESRTLSSEDDGGVVSPYHSGNSREMPN